MYLSDWNSGSRNLFSHALPSDKIVGPTSVLDICHRVSPESLPLSDTNEASLSSSSTHNMTRSYPHRLPIQTSANQDLSSRHPNVQLGEPGSKESKPKDPRNTECASNAPYARPCRECRSAEIECEEKRGKTEGCSRCATLNYICQSTMDDAVNAATTAAMAVKLPHVQSIGSQLSRKTKATPIDVESYTQPFLSFISKNPTTFHAVATVCKRLESHGFTNLSERDSWTNKLSRGGRYCFTRNGSSVVAFIVGKNYESGNGASVIATHIDALTTRVKPIPTLSTKAGYLQLGVAPYAGALNNTWWDRDLGIGGRVLVKDGKTGKIQTELVKLGWPIARIPTLAPHFGAAADMSHPNKETEMVPIIGLDNADPGNTSPDKRQSLNALGGAGTFTATQPERLVKAIAGEMNIRDCELRISSF